MMIHCSQLKKKHISLTPTQTETMPLILPLELSNQQNVSAHAPHAQIPLEEHLANDDELSINFPEMCEFERQVICEFMTKMLENDQTDGRFVITLKDLSDIITHHYNRIVESDRENSNPRSTVNRLECIGFTPVINSDGNYNMYSNPMCSLLLYQMMIGMNGDNREHLIQLMTQMWSKFLAYYFPDIDFN